MTFLMFKLVLEKAEEPEIKLPTFAGSWKKQESSRKTSTSALLTMPKLLTVWITINCGKFWERWEYQTTWPASWEICMQVRKQQLELDMEQQAGSKQEKEHIKAVYCYPAYYFFFSFSFFFILLLKCLKQKKSFTFKCCSGFTVECYNVFYISIVGSILISSTDWEILWQRWKIP